MKRTARGRERNTFVLLLALLPARNLAVQTRTDKSSDERSPDHCSNMAPGSSLADFMKTSFFLMLDPPRVHTSRASGPAYLMGRFSASFQPASFQVLA